MTTLQVRDVDARDHEALKALAKARGVSLQVYLADVVHREAVRGENARLLGEHEAKLKAIGGTPMTVAELDGLLAAGRREDDERAERNLREIGLLGEDEHL